jgi:glycine/D-amino acid oxidase-like deaminating enzyme
VVLEPEVVFPAGGGEAVLFPDEGWIAGRSVVERLVVAAARRGAEVHVGVPVDGIHLRDGRVVEVRAANGRRHVVDAVVNAAGPAATRVAAMVGRALPLRDAPGIIARLKCGPVPVHRSMHAPGVGIRPDGDQGVVVHCPEVDARIAPASGPRELAIELRRRAVELVPSLAGAEVVGARVAWRPMPEDGRPSVGGLDGVGGYYEAVTHSGVTLAAIIGRCLAGEILDGAVDELVRPYRPGRFARGT